MLHISFLKYILLISVIIVLALNAKAHEEYDAEIPQIQLPRNFLDEYKLLLKTNNEESKLKLQRTKDSGFKYIKGSDSSLMNIPEDADFSLIFEKGTYIAKWEKNGNKLVECSFPANIGMLKFCNKIDLENEMIAKLQEAAALSSPKSLPLINLSRLQPIEFSEYFFKDEGRYITPRLRNMTIYEKSKDNYGTGTLLIDDVRYQVETIANFMLSGFSPNPVNLNTKIKQYGYKTTNVNIPLYSLFDVFSKEGSIPYWGVQTFDGKTLKGLYVWVNEAGGFIHLMNVTVPVEIISTGGTIDADLSCYVRTDNLKILFEEYPEL